MFAGIHRVDSNRRVPVIHRGDDHRVDVLSIKQPPVVVVNVAGLDAHELLCAVAVLGENVARGGGLSIVLGGVVFYLPNMGVKPLVAHTDEADIDAVVGPEHPAG